MPLELKIGYIKNKIKYSYFASSFEWNQNFTKVPIPPPEEVLGDYANRLADVSAFEDSLRQAELDSASLAEECETDALDRSLLDLDRISKGTDTVLTFPTFGTHFIHPCGPQLKIQNGLTKFSASSHCPSNIKFRKKSISFP